MTAPARTYTPSSTTSVVVSLPGSSRSGWNHKPRARFSLRRRRTSRRTARPPPSWPTRAWRTSTARSTISSASANCAAYLPRSKSASRKPGPMHGLCSLKHGWLYLHQLDTFAALERLVAFYVEQHNTVLPHAAFAGQTPDEMYFGRGERVPGDLAAARAHARESRMKANRSLTCAACRVPAEPPPLAISDLLQLRPEESRMS